MGALTAGLMNEQSAAPSRAGLAVSATQWVAGGFLTMAAATAVAAAITVIRWLMNRHAAASGTPPRPEPLAADRLTSRSGSPSGPEAESVGRAPAQAIAAAHDRATPRTVFPAPARGARAARQAGVAA